MIKAHTHDILDYQRCKRRFLLGNKHHGLGYKSPYYNHFINFGNLFHSLMAELHGNHETEEVVTQKIFEDFAKEIFGSTVSTYHKDFEAYNETAHLFTTTLKAYNLWRNDRSDYYGDHNLHYYPEFVECEWELARNDCKFGGRIDGLVQHTRTGEHWIIEHKTTGNPMNLISGLSWALQPRMYTWAARKLYPELNVVGVLYNVVTPCDPWIIKMLQNGFPSKAKAELTRTTYEAYRSIIIEAVRNSDMNIDETKALLFYDEQLELLRLNEYPPFMRHPHRVFMNDEIFEQHLINYFLDIDRTVKLFEEVGETAMTPNLTGHISSRYGGACAGCPFANVCNLMDTGGDVWQDLLQASFEREEK